MNEILQNGQFEKETVIHIYMKQTLHKLDEVKKGILEGFWEKEMLSWEKWDIFGKFWELEVSYRSAPEH